MKKVLVLMSCYNGALYLKTQLDSLFSQKNVNLKILVRDDGSTDDTRAVLKKYERYENFSWYAGDNIGWRRSFMHLALNAPDSDYYAFCDQDDFWLPNKLSCAIEILEKNFHSNELQLYFSNLVLWKNERKSGNVYSSNIKYSRYSSIYQNPAIGCTVVFNQALLDFVKKRPFLDVYAHDFWFFQTAVFFGKIVYDPCAKILYRQHENNQIGVKTNFWSRVMQRWHNFFSTENISRSQNAKNFLKIYEKDLSAQDYAMIDVVANYNKSFVKKVKFLFSSKYTMNALENTILLKIRILFNRF